MFYDDHIDLNEIGESDGHKKYSTKAGKGCAPHSVPRVMPEIRGVYPANRPDAPSGRRGSSTREWKTDNRVGETAPIKTDLDDGCGA